MGDDQGQQLTADSQARELKLQFKCSRAACVEAVESLREFLSSLFEEPVRTRLVLAVDEAIQNAYEHGNLGISHDEKTAACDEGGFDELLAEKEKVAQAAGKVINVLVTLSQSELTCMIEDQGSGFNWRQPPQQEEDLESLLKLHGRGLILINNAFDGVSYNEKGNQITLKKSLKN